MPLLTYFSLSPTSLLVMGTLSLALIHPARASLGTEGAAFLDIPVGAGPAALGGAYTALAKNAYAATWNPAGLGFLESLEFSGQHLSYLGNFHYEYLSFAVPLSQASSCSSDSGCTDSAFGGSVQYLGSGDIGGTDAAGDPTGTYSSHDASYNLSYGRLVSKKLALGLTGKLINSKIQDVSAMAYAVDLGGMYQVNPSVALAATLTNLGSRLKFLTESDPLPAALHMGASYQPTSNGTLSSELVYRKSGLASMHLGAEWRPLSLLALRTGFRTDTLKELSTISGFSAGMGVRLWGQELSYAWLPYGDLGTTHYISIVLRFGETEKAQRNLIQYKNIKKHNTAAEPKDFSAPDYQQLLELPDEKDPNVAKKGVPDKPGRN